MQRPATRNRGGDARRRNDRRARRGPASSLALPPRDGDAEGFGAYYDLRGDVRRATVELRNVDTQGTITVPAVFAPPTDSLPDRLHCSFTVRAWRLGAFGQTVTLTDRGSLPLETAE
ncbi:hypothetical protein ACFQL0_18990 [Haloplanus litoreus]|uniref:hypothetical protein n=1 Tax=Haloplanus litoreus TaxID=767515 RepID=UPI0036211F81